MNKQEMNAADIARAAKHASFALAAAPSNVRDNALLSVAAALRAKAGHIFAANEKDMEAAEKEGLSAPALKRLRFDEDRQSYYLHPENKDMEDIYVSDLRVQGVATHVIKAL